MQSLSTDLVVSKAQNQVPVWGIPFSPASYIVALAQNTDTTIQIPFGLDVAIFHYSAGSTVIVKQGLIGDTISAPNSTPALTSARINPMTAAVSATDDSGATYYLHLFSPNTNDWVSVSFYSDGFSV